jgi:hypothetical protein
VSTTVVVKADRRCLRAPGQPNVPHGVSACSAGMLRSGGSTVKVCAGPAVGTVNPNRIPASGACAVGGECGVQAGAMGPAHDLQLLVLWSDRPTA